MEIMKPIPGFVMRFTVRCTVGYLALAFYYGRSKLDKYGLGHTGSVPQNGHKAPSMRPLFLHLFLTMPGLNV